MSSSSAAAEWRDLKALYGTLARELESDSLQHVEPGIYREIADMLGSLKGRGYDGLEAKVKDALVALVADIGRALLSLRMEKLRRASATTNTINYTNLTDEERYILEAESERHRRFELVLSATLKGRTKVLESVALKAKTVPVLVRFVKPMKTITGDNDRVRYGPFEREDVAVLPFENARALIEQGIVVELPWLDY